jgi:2,5-dioxopentanoate dehydrogenase
MRPVLIGGNWREAKPSAAADSQGLGLKGQTGRSKSFTAVNPATGAVLSDAYPVSGWQDCDVALREAVSAAKVLEDVDPKQIAGFLRDYARRIEEGAAALCAQASQETALPVEPRLLKVELPRTVDQLRQAANVAETGCWRDPVIDCDRKIYSSLGPIGPVIVFGPNNFPLAFNAVSGGDFAAAITAGNPVIAKSHPAHPATTRLLAEMAFEAIRDSGLPEATLQLLYGIENETGFRLVADRRAGAIAFTGSRIGGMALKEAADKAGIPIYLEMSSVNPVFILPDAIAASPRPASELVTSCLGAGGQFCTRPNLFVVMNDDSGRSFVEEIANQFSAAPLACLLTESVADHLGETIARKARAGGQLVCGGVRVDPFRYKNTLLSVDGKTFLENPHSFQSETFGPSTLAVFAESPEQMLEIAKCIEGSLTGCIYFSHADDLARQLTKIVSKMAGRVLHNKMPTGVAVSPAMNHGGPWPATGHPGFTAVGLPASIRRFAKLTCYDNVSEEFLPACVIARLRGDDR